MAKIDTTNAIIQSPNLYMQCCSSTEYRYGNYLRWELTGNKQNMLPTEKEPIRLYVNKTNIYIHQYAVTTDLVYASKSIIKGNVRQWRYSNGLILNFPDITRYDIVNSRRPDNTVEFLWDYDDVVEISMQNKLMFAITIDIFTRNANNNFKVETISAQTGNHVYENEVISNRRSLTNITTENNSILLKAENISRVRFKSENCIPMQITVSTYENYLNTLNTQDEWRLVDEFGLTTDNEKVYSRLNGSLSSYPYYSNVNVENYIDKWNGTNNDPGLRSAVEEYIASGSPDVGIDEYGMPLCNILKMIAMDYHVARMLGLGYMHYASDSSPIYAIQHGNDIYITTPFQDLTPIDIPNVTQKNITYGISTDNGTTIPAALTDANGYYKDCAKRAVNISIEKAKSYYIPIEPFFYTATEFEYIRQAIPIMYGIQIRRNGTSEWEEISVDNRFLDKEGNPEIVPIIGSGNNDILYTHNETVEGTASYRVYGINWFSMKSELSNVKSTNQTVFVKKNVLMPPLNFATQLIQPEKNLLLTTAKEQTMLAELQQAGSDTTLVRVTFDWNHIQNGVYENCKEIEFFFRQNPIKQVKGRVSKVVPSTTDGRFKVHVESYTINSVSPAVVVSPAVTTSDKPYFTGGILNVDGENFIITDVQTSANMPVFEISPIKEMTVAEGITDEQNAIRVENEILPRVGAYCVATENATSASNWNQPLSVKAKITRFSNYRETLPKDDDDLSEAGKQVYVGGIYETAKISKRLVKEKDTAGNETEIFTGLYDIVFDSYKLIDNPNKQQLGGEWYKGVVRIAQGDETYALNVLNIETDNAAGKLQLLVEDPNFSAEQQPTFDGSASKFVNFHPGYRLYLKADSGRQFDTAHIMPGGDDETRKTYLACRSTDGNEKSALSSIGVVYARKLYETKDIKSIDQTTTYASRPDFYGKSSYTFDVEIDTAGGRSPYMLLFSRYAAQKNDNGEWIPYEESIVPLTESPIVYKQMTVADTTSKAFPAVKLTKSGKSYVRFTDYTLEGAADAVYFYGVQELDNTMTMGNVKFVGPVRLIDTSVPDSPQIEQVVVEPSDSFTGTEASIKFDIKPYNQAEQISSVAIYRTTDIAMARSIRTMTLVKKCSIVDFEDIADTFDDVEYPPYGEPIFYRLAAIRRIKNEHDEDIEICSVQSAMLLANIEDSTIPALPQIEYDSQTKKLEWQPTCYKGTYRLYKMTSFGNWELIETYERSSTPMQYDVSQLPANDEYGNAVYHHFKVEVANTSGIESTNGQMLTISIA